MSPAADLPFERPPARWELAEPPVDPDPIAAELGLSPLLARLLTMRGVVDGASARQFLDGKLATLPDPAEMTDVEAAADRLARACHDGERVVVHGDYDVDGITSTALLTDFLAALGVDVEPVLPLRLRDGYGLSVDAVERYAEQGFDLLVTCDCGVTAFQSLARARELGLDVVVLDHHRLADDLPEAAAVVDPERDGDASAHGRMCAAGVVFTTLIALRRTLRRGGYFEDREQPNLRACLDMVALGTVADMVPLTGTNRLLVRHGLRELARRRRLGLASLLEVSDVRRGDPVDAVTLGFRLGPRINAAGRLADPNLALELLLAEVPSRARALATELDELNRRRRQLEERVLDEAMARIASEPRHAGTRAIALMGEGWHPGVLGIVASRIAQRLHRPVVLLAQDGDVGTGSARSIAGVDLIAALRETEPLLERCGGHAAAAGLSLRAERFETFRARFEDELFADMPDDLWIPRMKIDAELEVERVDLSLAHALRQLAPHGQGNPEPQFLSRGVEVRGTRAVRRGAIQMKLGSAPGIDAVAFRLGRPASAIGRRVDVVYAINARRFRGVESVQIRVADLRNAE